MIEKLDYSVQQEGVTLRVRIQPNASKNEIVGLYDRALKVKIQSPPVDGAANKALLSFLAKTFGLSKQSVKIISGEKNRDKRILFNGLSENVLLKHLQHFL